MSERLSLFLSDIPPVTSCTDRKRGGAVLLGCESATAAGSEVNSGEEKRRQLFFNFQPSDAFLVQRCPSIEIHREGGERERGEEGEVIY